MEIDHTKAPHLGIDPISHESQVRSDYDETFDTSDQQTNHGTEPSQRAFPAELIKIIRDIRKEEIPAPTQLEFIFDMTEEAAEKNFLVLKKYNFDLDKAILHKNPHCWDMAQSSDHCRHWEEYSNITHCGQEPPRRGVQVALIYLKQN